MAESELPEVPKAPNSLKQERESARFQPRRSNGQFAHSELGRRIQSEISHELFGTDISGYVFKNRNDNNQNTSNPTVSPSASISSSSGNQNQSNLNLSTTTFQKITPTQISGTDVVDAINKLNTNLISAINNLGSVSESIVSQQNITNRNLDNLNSSFTNISEVSTKTNIILRNISDILDKQKYASVKQPNINFGNNDNQDYGIQGNSPLKKSNDNSDFLGKALEWGETGLEALGGLSVGRLALGQKLINPLSKLAPIGSRLGLAVGRSIPLLGDMYQGYRSYEETGSVGQGVAGALGSFGGRIIGGTAGTAVGGPLGGFAGQVGGSEVGRQSANKLFDWMFNSPAKRETQEKTKELEKNNKFDIKGQEISLTGTTIKLTADRFEFNGAISSPNMNSGFQKASYQPDNFINPYGEGNPVNPFGGQSGGYGGSQNPNFGVPGRNGQSPSGGVVSPYSSPGQRNPKINPNPIPGLKGPDNTPLSGKAASVRSFFQDQLMKEAEKAGLNFKDPKAVASAFAGQALQESGFDPNKSHDSGTGFGMFGHRDDPRPGGAQRRTNMFNWLRQNGYDLNSMEGQARYAAHEAVTQYPKLMQMGQNVTKDNLADFTTEVRKKFEAPNPLAANDPERIRGAAMAYNNDPVKNIKPYPNESEEQLAERIKRLSPNLTNEQCVSLAKSAMGDQSSVTTWRRGEGVSSGNLKPGTPVATFMDRRGNPSERYDAGGIGAPGNNTTHAGVFSGYERDRAGNITGMRMWEQYRGSGGPHLKFYPMDDRRGGAKSGSNYYSIQTPNIQQQAEQMQSMQNQSPAFVQNQSQVEQLSSQSEQDEAQKRTPPKQAPIVWQPPAEIRGKSNHNSKEHVDPKVDEPKKHTLNDRHKFSEYYDI